MAEAETKAYQAARKAMSELEAMLPKAAGVELNDLYDAVELAQHTFLVFSKVLVSCGMQRGLDPKDVPPCPDWYYDT